MSNLIVPSSPADRKAIKDAVSEGANSMVRIDAEKDNIKAIAEDMKHNFDLPPNVFKKMVTVFHKQNFAEVTLAGDDFRDMYEILFASEAVSAECKLKE